MDFPFVLWFIRIMTMSVYHHLTIAVNIKTEFSIKTNNNLTCGEKESFTTPTKLYCASKCPIMNDNICFGFSYNKASSQCEVCLACPTSLNQPQQLASGALQYQAFGPNISEELAKGNVFFLNSSTKVSLPNITVIVVRNKPVNQSINQSVNQYHQQFWRYLWNIGWISTSILTLSAPFFGIIASILIEWSQVRLSLFLKFSLLNKRIPDE